MSIYPHGRPCKTSWLGNVPELISKNFDIPYTLSSRNEPAVQSFVAANSENFLVVPFIWIIHPD